MTTLKISKPKRIPTLKATEPYIDFIIYVRDIRRKPIKTKGAKSKR